MSEIVCVAEFTSIAESSWSQASALVQVVREAIPGDDMNPKSVYGSWTSIGHVME